MAAEAAGIVVRTDESSFADLLQNRREVALAVALLLMIPIERKRQLSHCVFYISVISNLVRKTEILDHQIDHKAWLILLA